MEIRIKGIIPHSLDQEDGNEVYMDGRVDLKIEIDDKSIIDLLEKIAEADV